MTESLFRREALEAKRRGWLGSISLAQPLRLWVLTLGAALAATAVALFLTLGTYTRRSTVTGQLVPSMGLSTVLAPATGVVSRLEANEGARVSSDTQFHALRRHPDLRTPGRVEDQFRAAPRVASRSLSL